jgi:hypothetical protein
LTRLCVDFLPPFSLNSRRFLLFISSGFPSPPPSSSFLPLPASLPSRFLLSPFSFSFLLSPFSFSFSFLLSPFSFPS